MVIKDIKIEFAKSSTDDDKTPETKMIWWDGTAWQTSCGLWPRDVELIVELTKLRKEYNGVNR